MAAKYGRAEIDFSPATPGAKALNHAICDLLDEADAKGVGRFSGHSKCLGYEEVAPGDRREFERTFRRNYVVW